MRLLPLLFLLNWCSVNAFTLSITVDGSNVPSRFGVVVSRYHNGGFATLDTLLVEALPYRSQITISGDASGLFAINVLNETNQAEFIWSPSDDNLLIETNYWSLKNGFIEVVNSVENQAYGLLLEAKRSFDPRLDYLEARLRTTSPFEKTYKHLLAAYEDSLDLLCFEYNLQLQVIGLQFPQTFTAKTLVTLNEIPLRRTNSSWANEYDGYLALMNERYFELINLNDSALLNHYALEDKIILYLDRYTLKTTDGAEKGINVIMNSLSENPKVRSFVYNLLLKNFINFKTETLARYLIDRHADGCALSLGVQELKRLSEMQSLMEGGKLPNVNLLDKNDQPHDLSRYSAKNKYTIVYVWISWCAMCQSQSPRVASLYDRFKKKGLGVYAISLDETKEDWEAALEKQDVSFPNVSELVPIKNSSVAPRFGISTTPKIFVIDPNGTIVAKDIYGDELEQKVISLFSN